MSSKAPAAAPVKPVAPARTPAKTPARKVAAKKAPTRKAAARKVPPRTVARAPDESAKAKPAAAPKKVKHKLVRDSFTMPQDDFRLIDQLKDRALGFKRPVKKSELLRAGLQALAGLSDAKLKAALEALVPLKPGRPRKTGE